MILSENLIKAPGYRYKIKVNCFATRRLTTIEWIIMSCINKFHDDYLYGEYSLIDIFEKVMKIKNSEFLIKPCMENLIKLEVIKIERNDNILLSKLKISEIEISSKGREMLEEGLLPGERREEGTEVYYNILTGNMTSFEPSSYDNKDYIELETTYDIEFPSEEIIDNLRNGKVQGQKFTASKYKIDSIEMLNQYKYDSNMKLLIETDYKGNIHTKPLINKKDFISNLYLLLAIPGVDDNMLKEALPISDVSIRTLLGSGIKVKQNLLDVCKNGYFIFMHSRLFKILKKNTSVFKNKVIILFESNKFLVEKGDNLIISLPFKFVEKSCLVVNEKNNHVNYCLGTFQYIGQEFKCPIAYEDANFYNKTKKLVDWIENIIEENYLSDNKYLALYSLIIFKDGIIRIKEKLEKMWTKNTFLNDKLNILNSINETYEMIAGHSLDISSYIEDIILNIEYNDYKKSVTQINEVLKYKILEEKYNKEIFILGIINRIKAPNTYVELINLYNAFGSIPNVSSEEIILNNNRKFHSDILLQDVVGVIINNKYKLLPEIFEMDIFFNELYLCINNINLLLNKLNLFLCISDENLTKALNSCPDISSLASHIRQLRYKEMSFIEMGYNLINIMEMHDNEKSNNYVINVRKIENNLNANLLSSEQKFKNVFIIDTCSLIHQPDLFDYFSEDDMIRVPTKVVDELGKIKDGYSFKYGNSESQIAREVNKKISKCLSLMNVNNKARFLIENASLELLPIDLDPSVPDNQILSVALKYKDKSPIIISDDGVFQNIASSQQIGFINSYDFVNKNINNKKSLKYDDYKEMSQNANVVQLGNSKIKSKEEHTPYKELAIDILPIKVLSKYDTSFSQQVISYLNENKILTIGDFRKLNPDKVKIFPGNAKKNILKNNILKSLEKIEVILEKVKL